MSNHTLTYGMKARNYDTTDFQDASVKRILNKLSDIERAGLPDHELIEVRGFRNASGTRQLQCSDWQLTRIDVMDCLHHNSAFFNFFF